MYQETAVKTSDHACNRIASEEEEKQRMLIVFTSALWTIVLLYKRNYDIGDSNPETWKEGRNT
jgi:hypothetical protein